MHGNVSVSVYVMSAFKRSNNYRPICGEVFGAVRSGHLYRQIMYAHTHIQL